MTRHFQQLAPDATSIPALLIAAARCWRKARDGGLSVQPCLSRTLDGHECTMLVPVLDSLCRFFEAALGRPITVGGALGPSDDEYLLLGLMDGSKPWRCLNCPHGAATALDCALCSTRIMLALTLGYPCKEGIATPEAKPSVEDCGRRIGARTGQGLLGASKTGLDRDAGLPLFE